MHIGFLNFDIVQADRWIDTHLVDIEPLPDDLSMCLTFGWYIDNYVTLKQGLTAKTASWQGIFQKKRFFACCVPGEVFGFGVNLEFGELANTQFNLATVTNSPTAANRIEINPELLGRGEHGFATLYLSSLP